MQVPLSRLCGKSGLEVSVLVPVARSEGGLIPVDVPREARE